MTPTASKLEKWLGSICRRENDLPGRDLEWLSSARSDAAARFRNAGFPTQKDEHWRFTNAGLIADKTFITPGRSRVSVDKLNSLTLLPDEQTRLVFVDGRFNLSLSKLSGMRGGAWVKDLHFALEEEPEIVQPYIERASGNPSAFGSLNEAYFCDGAVIHAPRGGLVAETVHLIFISTGKEKPTIANIRVIATAEAGSQLNIVEEYISIGKGVYFNNVVTDILAEEGSLVEHTIVQRESPNAFHVGNLRVRLHRESTFTAHNISLGGGLVRREVTAIMDGEGADCTLNGLYIAGGRQHIDNSTLIDHVQPRGSSRELYKGILDGKAHAVFNGAVVVRAGAQKTDARVYNKNLLLSKDAVINTKPEFRIDANDVSCKHGATIGQISDDALFYLRSRGLDADTARRLLVHAFASEMIEKISLPRLREALVRQLGTYEDGGQD